MSAWHWNASSCWGFQNCVPGVKQTFWRQKSIVPWMPWGKWVGSTRYFIFGEGICVWFSIAKQIIKNTLDSVATCSRGSMDQRHRREIAWPEVWDRAFVGQKFEDNSRVNSYIWTTFLYLYDFPPTPKQASLSDVIRECRHGSCLVGVFYLIGTFFLLLPWLKMNKSLQGIVTFEIVLCLMWQQSLFQPHGAVWQTPTGQLSGTTGAVCTIIYLLFSCVEWEHSAISLLDKVANLLGRSVPNTVLTWGLLWGCFFSFCMFFLQSSWSSEKQFVFERSVFW